MKVAVTADVHLTTRERNPERFQVVENILSSLLSAGIDTLIVAGDLFDASLRSAAEFESLFKMKDFRDLKLIIIPGNHDSDLNNAHFTSSNLAVVSEPALVQIADEALPILFVPYSAEKNMGEVISAYADQFEPERWILVGHGDWSSGLRIENPYEPGVFMPLTRRDIDIFRPAAVFLGHIHSPLDLPPVYYAGSPCGLDITETGYRRILLCDLPTGQVEQMTVDTPHLFFNETFTIFPDKNEEEQLVKQIERRVRDWQLAPGDEGKVQLRLKVKGYSTDRSRLKPVIGEALGPFSYYKGEEPDLSEVFIASDSERNYIAESVKARIEELPWPEGSEEPGKEEIILEALHLIYGD